MSVQTATQTSSDHSDNEPYVPLPLRQHTILGTCEAIGEDFGFNPIFLRIPLAAAVLWSPVYAIGAYFALSLIVLAARLLFAQPKATQVTETAAIESDNDQAAREQLQIAA